MISLAYKGVCKSVYACACLFSCVCMCVCVFVLWVWACIFAWLHLCICTCVCMNNVCITYVCMHVCIWRLLCTCVWMSIVFVCLCVYTCMHVWAFYVCIFLCMCSMCVYSYMCISVCLCICFVHMFLCGCIGMYVYVSVDTVLESILFFTMGFQVIKIRLTVLMEALSCNESFHCPTNNQLTNSVSECQITLNAVVHCGTQHVEHRWLFGYVSKHYCVSVNTVLFYQQEVC